MLILIGILIGLVLGLTGAGGSVFAVPLLLLLGGLSMNEATGISLAAVAASTIYASVRNKWQRNKPSVLWKPGFVLAITGAFVAPLGQWSAQHIPEVWLVIGFATLSVIIAWRMWLTAQKNPAAASIVRAGNFSRVESPDHLCNLNPTGQFVLRPRCVSGLILGGILVGFLSGLLGVGGGFLIVPLLLALSAVSMQQAAGTSLMIIALVSSSGFVSHLFFNHQQDYMSLLWVALGGVFGMILGQVLSEKLANQWLQKIFSISLFMVSILMLVRLLK